MITMVEKSVTNISDGVLQVQKRLILLDIMRVDSIRIRGSGYGYANTDTKIRIRGYGYTDKDTRIRIRGYA